MFLLFVSDSESLTLLLSDPSFLRTLDSSIKRNTAVIKKLKQISEEQRESLMDELRSVNLSKFVTEAVTAICDAKLKTSDLQAAVQVLLTKLLVQFHGNLSCLLAVGIFHPSFMKHIYNCIGVLC